MTATQTPFLGPERRKHHIFITRNTEYHVRSGEVIAVRPRGSEKWLPEHDALHMKVQGRVPREGRMPIPGTPQPGERLYLAGSEDDVVTSTVVAIERPPKALVEQYPPTGSPDSTRN
jgi:hypothetical protein